MKRGGPLRRVGKKGRRDMAELHDVREAVMARSHAMCEVRWSPFCHGWAEQLHHVVRRSQGGTNTAENVLVVCSPCHARIHDAPAEALTLGFLKPGWTGDAA